MQHIKKLDSLRALAAMLVILYHWLPADSIVNTFNNGAIGVNIFFVLSGFLITKILLQNRDEAEGKNNNRWSVYKNFYIRRALRIFPIYYLLAFLILVFHGYLHAKLGRSEFINTITYTINFHFFNNKYWGTLTTPFWSLAVEEQFYLMWPLIILFIQRKYIVHAIMLFIGVGVVSQCLVQDFQFGYIPTYTCLDSFGLGAGLSWIMLYKPDLLNKVYRYLSVLSIFSFIIVVAEVIYGDFSYFPQRTLHSIIALWMITYIILDKGRRRFSFSSFLDNKYLFFLGKISYGIYLYHIPIEWIGYRFAPLLKQYLPSPFVNQYQTILLLIDFTLLIFISWLSFKFIEKPILKMKKYFNYQEDPNHYLNKSEKILAAEIIAIK